MEPPRVDGDGEGVLVEDPPPARPSLPVTIREICVAVYERQAVLDRVFRLRDLLVSLTFPNAPHMGFLFPFVTSKGKAYTNKVNPTSSLLRILRSKECNVHIAHGCVIHFTGRPVAVRRDSADYKSTSEYAQMDKRFSKLLSDPFEFADEMSVYWYNTTDIEGMEARKQHMSNGVDIPQDGSVSPQTIPPKNSSKKSSKKTRKSPHHPTKKKKKTTTTTKKTKATESSPPPSSFKRRSSTKSTSTSTTKHLSPSPASSVATTPTQSAPPPVASARRESHGFAGSRERNEVNDPSALEAELSILFSENADAMRPISSKRKRKTSVRLMESNFIDAILSDSTQTRLVADGGGKGTRNVAKPSVERKRRSKRAR